MKSLAQGRIVLWEGASLWAFDVPPLRGARKGTDPHSHHAIQVTFSVDGHFVFRIDGRLVEGPLVVIAPDVTHAYEPVGQNAMVFIEPESRIGAALLRELAGRDAAAQDPARIADIAAEFSCIWKDPRPDDATLAALGRRFARRMAGDEMPAHAIDARIARVLDRLTVDPDAAQDASWAAGVACLSPSRFSHLFVEEIGLPFRTYLLWRRLTVAVDNMAAGAPLTEAAHAAGFADSAHFSRTFLRMFGLPASLLEMI